ncbi:NmrA family NAD(P)-binding protein [Mycolicibacterium palauense]|uniref:NmrA family NAD(P)-binding protein n=1 Tax=Mycolicibacterium palauense TaxID=2034511 RepID=UPI000BFF141D|nr:NAD(P)H-binding protein [Mycolicibacterium palauense]
MADETEYLVTGAGARIGGVSDSVVQLLTQRGATVRALVHREEHADALRALGAQVVVGDLTDPHDVVSAMRGVRRVFFNMGVSSSYLQAATLVSAAGRDHGSLETVVNMSQMTVSEMSLTSAGESTQQRLHWLAEQVMDWSGLPVTHVRPTVFMDNPLFTSLNAGNVRERGELILPFGTGRTSPIAASDVAQVVTALLADPAAHHRKVYELTGPEVLDVDGLARSYSRVSDTPVAGVDMPYPAWREEVLAPAGIPPHVEQHIATMARLHRAGRYDRFTDTVEQVTGHRALTFEQYIASHRQKFGIGPRSTAA